MRWYRRQWDGPYPSVGYVEVDDSRLPVREIYLSDYPWDRDLAEKYSREFPQDRRGELGREPVLEDDPTLTEITQGHFNRLWCAVRGTNPAAYGLTEWEDGPPENLPGLPALFLAEMRLRVPVGQEHYPLRARVETFTGDLPAGESWTFTPDGEYEILRFYTLAPRVYYAWHFRYPGEFPTDWPDE